MALSNPVVQNRKSSTTPPGTPPPTPDPVQDANRARIRARFMEEQRRNADARRASLAGASGGGSQGFGKPAAGAGGEQINSGRIYGDGSRVVRSNERGQAMVDNPVNGGNVEDRSLPENDVPIPPATTPDPATGQQSAPVNRHPNRNRQQPAGQITQEAAQALYNDNTIPHEFKGQLMELARSGNAQSFAQTLFGSGLPQETKLRLMQLFGFGGAAQGGNPQAQVQQELNQVSGQGQFDPIVQGVANVYNNQPIVPQNPRGSQYYGAF